MGRGRNVLAVVAGAAIVMASVVVVQNASFADDDNSDDFAMVYKKRSGTKNLPVVPKVGTPEFAKLLLGACLEAEGKGNGDLTDYAWHMKDSVFSLWEPVRADGCTYVSGSQTLRTDDPPRAYPGDWRAARAINCSQDSGTLTKAYQTTKIDANRINVGFSFGGAVGLSEIASVTWKISVNYEHEWGSWIWEGNTIVVPPGQVGWLESTSDIAVQTGKFKLRFPHPLRGHYEWYTTDLTMESPIGGGSTIAQIRRMNDDEIRSYCPSWDWNRPNPNGSAVRPNLPPGH
jgi:hypothetical protein